MIDNRSVVNLPPSQFLSHQASLVAPLGIEADGKAN
jgi:hypothetical protein